MSNEDPIYVILNYYMKLGFTPSKNVYVRTNVRE